MKKTALFLVLALLVTISNSQDLLYFSNGNMLKVTNFKQSPDAVNFNIYNSTTDQVYYINKNELVKHIAESGDITEFSGKYLNDYNANFNSNIVSINVLNLPMGRFTMLYQFINKSGKVGYEIPVSIGITPNANTDPRPEIFDIEFYSLFYTGLTVNLYPMGHQKVNYFLGPSFRIGFGQEEYWDHYSYTEYNYQGYYSKFLINNGLMLTPSEHFSMSFIISLGIMHRNSRPEEDKFGTVADLAFNLSYRF